MYRLSAAIEPDFFKLLPSLPSTLGSAATSCDGRARAAATAATATVASVTALAAANTCLQLSEANHRSDFANKEHNKKIQQKFFCVDFFEDAFLEGATMVVTFSPGAFSTPYALLVCYVLPFGLCRLNSLVSYITHINTVAHARFIFLITWSPALRCGLALRARPGLSPESEKVAKKDKGHFFGVVGPPAKKKRKPSPLEEGPRVGSENCHWQLFVVVPRPFRPWLFRSGLGKKSHPSPPARGGFSCVFLFAEEEKTPKTNCQCTTTTVPI